MFKFRGKRKDNGEWVVGWYAKSHRYHRREYHDTHLIYADNGQYEIHPHTLSISTGKLDSNGKEIFASFPIDGVMTEGGDVVEVKGNQDRSNNGVFEVKYMARWDSGCEFELISAKGEEYDNSLHGGIHSSEITIIGKQGGGK